MNKILLATLLLLPAVLPAQETGGMSAPVLKRAAYTISIAPKDPAAPAPDPKTVPIPLQKTAREINITRYDNLQRSAITWNDGSSTDSYVSDNLLITKSLSGNWINIFDITSDRIDSFYYLTFPNFFAWANRSTFVGPERFEGADANLFQRGKTGDRVWLDPKTGYPLAYSDGVLIYRFTFTTPPTAPPSMPPEYTKELERFVRIATAPRRISNKP